MCDVPSQARSAISQACIRAEQFLRYLTNRDAMTFRNTLRETLYDLSKDFGGFYAQLVKQGPLPWKPPEEDATLRSRNPPFAGDVGTLSSYKIAELTTQTVGAWLRIVSFLTAVVTLPFGVVFLTNRDFGASAISLFVLYLSLICFAIGNAVERQFGWAYLPTISLLAGANLLGLFTPAKMALLVPCSVALTILLSRKGRFVFSARYRELRDTSTKTPNYFVFGSFVVLTLVSLGAYVNMELTQFR
jgi:hypothetical protein